MQALEPARILYEFTMSNIKTLVIYQFSFNYILRLVFDSQSTSRSKAVCRWDLLLGKASCISKKKKKVLHFESHDCSTKLVHPKWGWIKLLFPMREENLSTREKVSYMRVDNQETEATYRNYSIIDGRRASH